MKIRVTVFGTLARRLPEASSPTGAEIQITRGTSAKDLLARLGIRKEHGGVVMVNGRILKMADEIPHGAEVRIFQSLHGG